MAADDRGAVFLEKLIVYTPLMLLFFMGFQLAEVSVAQLVVRRASAAAGRAAAVVLPDDPAFYDDEAPNVFEGRRRDDVYLATAMILSSAPQLGGDFTVDVSNPPVEEFGPIDVTVMARYHCGGVRLLCGMDGTVALTATTRHAYHRAEYDYDIIGGPTVAGLTQAMREAGTPGGKPVTTTRSPPAPRCQCGFKNVIPPVPCPHAAEPDHPHGQMRARGECAMPGPTGDGTAPISKQWASLMIGQLEEMKKLMDSEAFTNEVKKKDRAQLISRNAQLLIYAKHAVTHPDHLLYTYGQAGDAVAGMYLACQTLRDCKGANSKEFEELYGWAKDMYGLFRGPDA